LDDDGELHCSSVPAFPVVDDADFVDVGDVVDGAAPGSAAGAAAGAGALPVLGVGVEGESGARSAIEAAGGGVGGAGS